MLSVLLSPAERDLSASLRQLGAHIVTWPELRISPPEDLSALDTAIENLFGYDWLILKNPDAADFFLQRFQELNHQIDEFDALRICTIGEATANKLAESQIHIDSPIERFASDALFRRIESYVGGRESIQGLNFLIPSARMSRERFEQTLEDAGARVDGVPAYRTALDNQQLTRIKALLAGGGVDCVAFMLPSNIDEFARLCDTDDLSLHLSRVVIACLTDETKIAAARFALLQTISPARATSGELAQLIIASVTSP